MTWAEFQIRVFAYRRMQEREELLTREIAWNALIGSHSDPKRLPKTKNKFWQIGIKNVVADERVKEAIKKAQNDYFKRKKELING